MQALANPWAFLGGLASLREFWLHDDTERRYPCVVTLSSGLMQVRSQG